MNATAPQPLLSPAVHAAGIAAALAIIAVTTVFAGRASEDAVHSAQAAISPAIRYITLQPVEVIVRRTGEPVADTCANPAART
jgi:uncharacterized protein (UPF0212 family)